MTEKPRIVVGIDGSPNSLAAARWAIDYAREFNFRLHIVMAWEVSFWVNVNPVTTETSYLEMAEGIFDEAIASLNLESAGIDVETQLVQMQPGLALQTLSEGAAMLVVSGTGHGNVPGTHLGSVSGYCAHHATCPVLIHRT